MNISGFLGFLNGIGIIKEKKKFLTKNLSCPRIDGLNMNKYHLNSEKKKANNNITSRNGGQLLNENEATLIFNKIVFEKKNKFLDFKTFLLSFEFLSD